MTAVGYRSWAGTWTDAVVPRAGTWTDAVVPPAGTWTEAVVPWAGTWTDAVGPRAWTECPATAAVTRVGVRSSMRVAARAEPGHRWAVGTPARVTVGRG